MQLKSRLSLFAGALLLAAGQASATTITFDELAVGTTLSSQYAALGVSFAPNAFAGNSTLTRKWATNTDMTIVSTTGSDVGGLGTPSLVSGNLLRSFNGWLGEDGDASFSINFANAVNSFSADFAGVATPSSTRIFAFDGANLLGSVAGTTNGQFSLAFDAASITRVIVTPGDFTDWVGVDNIVFSLAPTDPAAVPEPASLALFGVGAALLELRRRRQNGR